MRHDQTGMLPPAVWSEGFEAACLAKLLTAYFTCRKGGECGHGAFLEAPATAIRQTLAKQIQRLEARDLWRYGGLV